MLKFDVYFKRTIELLFKELNLDKISKNKLNINFGVIPDDGNNDDILLEIMNYVNKIKNNGINMNEQERNNCYFEIVSSNYIMVSKKILNQKNQFNFQH